MPALDTVLHKEWRFAWPGLGNDNVEIIGRREQASSGAIAQAVSKNKNAIGYLGIGYADKSVRAFTVNGIVGNEETILNGTFPIAWPLFMFTQGWPTGDALKFINYVIEREKA